MVVVAAASTAGVDEADAAECSVVVADVQATVQQLPPRIAATPPQ